MSVQSIQGDECADPDVIQAIDDFLETGEEIRARSLKIINMKRDTPAHQAERAHIHELMTLVEARAGRIGLSTAALMTLINQALDQRARRGRAHPARPTARTLMTELTDAQAAQHHAEVELRAAKARHAACVARVTAAAAAARAWGAKPAAEAEAA